jgi:Protein of unknown function (DUF3303)
MLAPMLFMVIEHFKDVVAIGERFQRQGRMLPDGVVFHASWVEPGGARCYQVMEAASAEALGPWIDAWGDLAGFEVIPVLSSADFWAARSKPRT